VTGWLLDTNVLSELRRPKPERKVLAFVASQPLDLLYVSAASLAEIRFGIELVADANRRAELNDWLAHKVRPMFDERVLPITEDIMLKWRLLVEDGRRAGHTFSQPDLIIAATALHHGLTFVSRDTGDFTEGAGSNAQSMARNRGVTGTSGGARTHRQHRSSEQDRPRGDIMSKPLPVGADAGMAEWPGLPVVSVISYASANPLTRRAQANFPKLLTYAESRSLAAPWRRRQEGATLKELAKSYNVGVETPPGRRCRR
jgi:toxin FitB